MWVVNLDISIKYLAKLKKLFAEKYPLGWFVFYNYGESRALKSLTETDYYKRVVAAKRQTRVLMKGTK